MLLVVCPVIMFIFTVYGIFTVTMFAHSHPLLFVSLYLNMYCTTLYVIRPVIGKGGEQISQIQMESDCKVQFAPGLF